MSVINLMLAWVNWYGDLSASDWLEVSEDAAKSFDWLHCWIVSDNGNDFKNGCGQMCKWLTKKTDTSVIIVNFYELKKCYILKSWKNCLLLWLAKQALQPCWIFRGGSLFCLFVLFLFCLFCFFVLFCLEIRSAIFLMFWDVFEYNWVQFSSECPRFIVTYTESPYLKILYTE